MNESNIEPASASLPWGLLLPVGALAALGPFSIDLYLPAFGAIAEDLGAAPSEVQSTLSAYFVGLAAGQLVVGPLSDRLGRRGPILVGLALYALASVGCAFAGSVGALAAWRFVQAAGATAGLVGSRAVLRDRLAPRDMARALSLVLLLMGVAPIVAPTVGAMVHTAFGWRALFGLLTAYAALLLALIYFGLPETLRAPRRLGVGEVLSGYVELLGVRPFIGPVVAGSLAQAALFIYVGSSSFVLGEVYGLDARAYAIAFGANAMGLIAASQLNERLLRRYPLDTLMNAAIGLQALAALGVLAAVASGAGGLWGLSAPLFVCIACLGFVFPNTTASAMSTVGDRAGLAAAVLGVVQYGLAGLATLAAGAFYDGSALPMAVGMAATSVAAAAVLAFARARPSVRVAA